MKGDIRERGTSELLPEPGRSSRTNEEVFYAFAPVPLE